MEAEDQIRELAERLRSVKSSSYAIATAAAPELEAAARETATSGTDASGAAWAATKAGGKALAGAAGAISAVVSGSTVAVVTLILRGKYVFHQRGIGKGKGKPDAKAGTPAREVLPDVRRDGVPPKMLAILARVAQRVTAGIMGGRS